jgi:hypothetical protein
MPAHEARVRKLERDVDREEQKSFELKVEDLMALYDSLSPEGREELFRLLRTPPQEDKSG